MKNLEIKVGAIALALCALGATAAVAQTSPLIPGDLAVIIYGNANTPTANNSYADGVPTPLTLAQFPTTISAGVDNGTPALLETLPITGTGGNVGIVGEYGSSSEGTILVSGDGKSLTVGGYDGNLDTVGGPYAGSDALAQSTCANVPRVGAIINIATGTVNTSTVLNDIYNTNNTRGIYTQNGTTMYLSGQGAGKTDEGGLYLTNVGNNTTTGGPAPTPIFNQVSTRTVSEWNIDAAHGVASTTPNLYFAADQNSSSKGTLTGMFEYTSTPTGTQTTSGTRLTPASGTVNGQSVNFSPEGYFFANPTTLYIADTGDPKAAGTGAGGIQKWIFNGSSWQLAYIFPNPSFFVAPSAATGASSGETGMESLAGQVVGNQVNLYATSYTAGDDNPDGLYGVVDTLSATTLPSGAAVVQLAASTNDMDFKGVAIVPAAPANAPVSEPTMPQWGLIIMAVLLLGLASRLLPAQRPSIH